MVGWHILLGAVLAGPVCILLSLWACRRVWRNARRLTIRARGKERLIEVGQLVGGLAHEIKNPLSTINVNLTLLSEDLRRYHDEEHGRLARRLAAVRTEVGRLQGILDDFLRFAGKYELALKPTDLRRAIEELLDFFAPQAEAAHVVFRSSLPQTQVVCNIDENLVKQAVLNLMINAVQAMPEGGELLMRLSNQRSKAVIEVTDTGPGIPPEVLPRIFDAYYSTKRRGSGLGLPTTRRIVREHEGDIEVQSEPGKGTRFVVTLPLHKS